MEEKVEKFQLVSGTLRSLEAINDAIRKRMRKELKRPLLVKENPYWVFQNISYQWEGNGFHHVSVEGKLLLRTRLERRLFDANVSCRVVKRYGVWFVCEVKGTVNIPSSERTFPDETTIFVID